MRLPSHWNRAANAALFADSSQMMCESMRDGHVSIAVALMTLRLVSMPMAWRMIVPGTFRYPRCQFKGTGFTGVRHIGVGWSGKLPLVGTVAVGKNRHALEQLVQADPFYADHP